MRLRDSRVFGSVESIAGHMLPLMTKVALQLLFVRSCSVNDGRVFVQQLLLS